MPHAKSRWGGLLIVLLVYEIWWKSLCCVISCRQRGTQKYISDLAV